MNRIYLQLFAEEGEPKNGDGQNQAEPGNDGRDRKSVCRERVLRLV